LTVAAHDTGRLANDVKSSLVSLDLPNILKNRQKQYFLVLCYVIIKIY
jgi:hypothetical protein